MAYTASQLIAGSVFVDNLWFPINMAGSQAYALTTSTGSAVCLVKKEGVQIATLTFSAGNAVGVFAAMASAVSVAPGNRITIEAPASPDATLDNVLVTLYSV